MKKLTVFIDKTVRDQLRVGGPGPWSKAYRSALEWLGRLVAVGTDPYGDLETRARCLANAHKGHEKCLCPVHSRSKRLLDVFLEAQRVEVCLTLRDPSSLELYLCGYKKGTRKPFGKMVYRFNPEGVLVGYGEIGQ